MSLETRLKKIWYSRSGLTHLLRPLAWLYCSVVFIRRWLYRLHILRSYKITVPVVVVGNLTVGGTGKTPLVIAITKQLMKAGYRPGIVSRGYGGKARVWPQQVRPDSDPVMVGDEPILIAKRTDRPMAVDPDRKEAAKALLRYSDCDIIISDDGLQHYALKRDIEIAVVDGVHRFGNGFCLPAGPLREPGRRISTMDFVVTNGSALNNEYAMKYTGNTLVNMDDKDQICELKDFNQQNIHAIAGIGQPEKFFETLKKSGLKFTQHRFPDHFSYSGNDLRFGEGATILMTEKDAVKCQRFAKPNMWFLPVEAQLTKEFEMQLLNKIEACYG